MKTTYFTSKKQAITHSLLLLFLIGIIVWSAINPYGYFEWFFLALPALLFTLTLVVTYKSFRFTTLTYFMCGLQITIILIGSKYTCTYMPLFDYFKEIFNLSRNHYDRLCHLFQGFVPVFIMKELLIRRYHFPTKKMFYFLIYSVVLASSALFEIMEFTMCFLSNKPASYILAHQGDPFDTQWDMIMALIGASIAFLLFNSYHNRKIARIIKDNS